MKSCRPLFRKAGFFPFSLLSPILSAGREHGSTPIPRSAFCRHFVDIPFCGIATCCQFSVLFVATSIQSDRITRKIPADSADLQPKRAPLCRWTDCSFTSPATTAFRSFSE
ncbi:hypothetical protein NXW89_04830 [Bacteroides thetaiotaomicron]|nr:hypothetical protein [Bacteroides thetaiotaomicron]